MYMLVSIFCLVMAMVPMSKELFLCPYLFYSAWIFGILDVLDGVRLRKEGKNNESEDKTTKSVS